MVINWDDVQEKAGGNFKNFYEDGDYTVKCDGVEIKEVGTNGSIIMKFHFEEGKDGQYPTADHWLTFKEGKDNWRQWHNKCLMQVLGASEDAAKKGVEMAESKEGKENVVKGYEACYKKLLTKKPEVKIEVYTEVNPNSGKEYARAEFKDRSVNMNNGSKKEDKKPTETIVEEGEEIELDSLPF